MYLLILMISEFFSRLLGGQAGWKVIVENIQLQVKCKHGETPFHSRPAASLAGQQRGSLHFLYARSTAAGS